MGLIFHNVELTGTRKKKTVLALFDSGAESNHLRTELFDGDTISDIGFLKIGAPTTHILGDGHTFETLQVVFKKLQISREVVKDPVFCTSDSLSYDMIIGAELMQSLGLVLDPPNETIYFSGQFR